jgi:hypothetical protein
MPTTAKPKHEFWIQVEEDTPNAHVVKKNKNDATPVAPMPQEEVDRMWAGVDVRAIGLILQAPVGSKCVVVYIGGTCYKICP